MLIHECEQNTPEWLALRLGMPTSSNAKLLVSGEGKLSASMKGYAEKLAADKYAGEDIDAWDGNKFTERGHEIEPMARNWYAFRRDVDVVQVGFCTDNLLRYGASPDGLVGSPGAWLGCPEFKCLPKQHTASLLYFNKYGKVKPDYIPQTQMQMLVCEVEWADLTYYHMKLPPLCVRVHRDEDFIDKLKSQLKLCIEHRDETIHVLQKMQEAA